MAEGCRHVGVPAHPLPGREPVRGLGRASEEVGEFGIAEDVFEQVNAVLDHRVEGGCTQTPRVAPCLLHAKPHLARDQKQRQHDAHCAAELPKVAERVPVHAET